ncbi:hypothetical protein ACLOJK_024917 [Asimina triloba]
MRFLVPNASPSSIPIPLLLSKCFRRHRSTRARAPQSLLHLIDSCKSLRRLKEIHAKSIASDLGYDHLILEKIARSFLNGGDFDYARQLFVRIRDPDVFIKNAMIRAYSSSGTPCIALSIYNEMRAGGETGHDNYTFPFVLRACANCGASEKGREVHGTIVSFGYESDRFIRSSLLGFYAGRVGVDDARQVFDESAEKDVVFWNAMIMGYARAERVSDAFELFKEMEFWKVKPNEGTISGLISACATSKDGMVGREIHGYAKKNVSSDWVRIGASLIDLHAKCGNLEYAQKLFHEMPERNTVVWNSLISGYSRNGSPILSIKLFQEMHASNVRPDAFTVSSILSACAQTGALNLGDWVRKYIEKNHHISDVFVETALVDMYCKCGSIKKAREVFDAMHCKTLATWNAILCGHAQHGLAQCTLDLFHDMKKAGFRPDSITFIAILNACAHAGLVEDGYKYLDLMKNHYNFPPKVEHYGCMVDLLGRAGLLQEAKELIDKMDIEPNAIVWGALLSACSIHGNVEIGKLAAAHVFELDQADGGSYVLLSNMYALARRFDGVKAVREMMVERGVQKPPGCSMIEVGNVVHEFVAADKAHPRSEEIYPLLNELSRRMKISGYVPMLSSSQDE